MATHYKTDLLTDEALAAFSAQVGDVLTLDVPDATGKTTRGVHTVTAIETTDAGTHPDTGAHLTRLTLTLEG
jgi:hypothetical protein